MRRRQTQNIGEILQEFLRKNGLETKLAETRVIQAWEEILGKHISRLTRNLYIKNRILFVQMNSSVARSELNMIKTDLIARLNEKAGKSVIDDIVLR